MADNKDKKPQGNISYLPIGICLGLSMGMLFGSLLGNVGVGLCFGVGIGLCFGTAIDSFLAQKQADSSDKQPEDEEEKAE